MNFYKYAEKIEAQGLTTEIIAEAIAEHSAMRARTLDRYGRYKQDVESTPILQGKHESKTSKIDNKLANDYFSEIIDTKTGYMFGIPVDIAYKGEGNEWQKAVDAIEEFEKVNGLDDLNAEWCKFSSMCGYDAGLCYNDFEGQQRVMRVDPWETIIISPTAITEPSYAIRYFETWDEKKRVVVYDDKNKYTYEGKDYTAEELVNVETKLHMFDYCPLFGIPNNAELQGDADKVLSLIDGQDRGLSNMADEVEQFRLAYLLFIGYDPSEKDEEGKTVLDSMIKSGALYIPDVGEGQSISWLTKELDPEYVEAFLTRNEANITRFAKHVNFTDAAFGADITGPAMRYKLFALETKSKYFERKHTAALRYMFKVIGSAWNTKSIPFDYKLLEFNYTRNIPVNLLDEAQTATALSAIASKRTALSVVSVIKDVDEELVLIEEEKQMGIDLDNVDDNEDDDNTDLGA